MTYDQFWNDDVELVKFYREAQKLRQQAKNQDMWIQGMYIYEAILDASPVLHAFAKNGTKPTPYCDEPYPFFEEKKKKIEKKDTKAKMAMEMFMVNFNRKFEKKGGEEDGG